MFLYRNLNYGAKLKLTLPPQIDDLIIIPNHGLTGPGAPPGPEGGGSALKNLAMIASRYQGTKTTSKDGDMPEAKRARVESGKYYSR